jgi:bacteriorhodopsin
VWKARIICWQISQSKGTLSYEAGAISLMVVDASSAERESSLMPACFAIMNVLQYQVFQKVMGRIEENKKYLITRNTETRS